MDDLTRLMDDRLRQDHPLLLRGEGSGIALRALGYAQELGMPTTTQWRYVELWRRGRGEMLQMQLDPQTMGSLLRIQGRIVRTSNVLKGWTSGLEKYVVTFFGLVVPFSHSPRPWPRYHNLFPE